MYTKNPKFKTSIPINISSPCQFCHATTYLYIVYILIIIDMLPSALRNSHVNEQLLFDSIVHMMQIGASVFYVCYLLYNEMNLSRDFFGRIGDVLVIYFLSLERIILYDHTKMSSNSEKYTI